MAQACSARRRTRRGFPVLSLGIILILTGPAWSGSQQEPTKLQVDPKSEIDMIEVAPGTLENLGQPGVVQGSGDVFIDEVEPNDTSAAAMPLPFNPVRVRGNLYRAPFVLGQTDVDTFSFMAPAGARLYAAAITSGSAGSTDPTMEILDLDGTTIIESDLNDGSFGASASNVGGTVLPTGGTYYIRLRQVSITGPTLSGTIRPYDLYVRVLAGTPATEVEPNNNGQTPNPLPASGWISGVIDPVADSDTFSLTANAGDTIVVIQDLDPERDAPDWNGRTGIGIFNNNFLVTSDPGSGDPQPSEAIAMTARTTGTYVIYVDSQLAGGGGPAATYTLSVFVIPAKTRTCTTYTGTGGPITDLGTTDFTITIPDVRTVDYLRVSLNATHPALGDLDITLLGTDANEVVLVDDVLNTAGAGVPQINTILEDEAALPMNLFGIHSGMGYQNESLAGRMDMFKGMPAQGTWTLRVRDDTTANAGTLNSWSIDVCEAPPRPACLVPGPQENTILSTDFEAGDAGFTHSGTLDEWERGMPAFPPIVTAHSGTNAWMTDLDGNYELNANMNLVSPNLDLTSVTGRITLSWWQKYNIESASFDSYWVEVREVGNPASARRVFSWMGATMNRTVGNPSVVIPQGAGWGRVMADISSFAGRNIEVAYHLDTDPSVVLNGVAIDDFLVTSCTAIVGQAVANVGITKSDGQTTYFPGQVLTYTIVASNAGPSAVAAAPVTDNFPADLTGVSWTCTASAGSSCGGASGTGDINALVSLLSSGTATFTATATVSMAATGPIVNTATIAAPAGTADPDPANNSATDTDVLAAAVPVALAVDTGGNGVYQPNETVVVAPTWRNTGATAIAITGALTNHTGPAGPTYTIPDGAADYGTVAVGSTASCTATGNCYSVANTAATRPATHWDSTALETVTPAGATKTWTLHVGNSFTDVPASNGFYRFIETIVHNQVTGGCSGTTYCPANPTTREQMAVFVLVSKEGPAYVPPACGTPVFADVPASSPFCRWIEELARRGVVSGCGGGNYCPAAPATREQMSVFVLRTLDPALNPPACGTPVFADVPASSPFCRWIEELVRRGVVTGCGGGNYCPTNPVTREQMAVFLTVTFGLTLYGL